MYPTIYHFFYDVFGIEIGAFKFLNSFGFFVAIAFIVASYLYVYELKRKEKIGQVVASKKKIIVGKPASLLELIISGLVGFLIGFKFSYLIFHYSDVIGDPQSFILSSKGNFIGGLIIGGAAAYWAWREKEKDRLPEPKEEIVDFHPHQHVGQITFLAAVFGIIGAKLFAFLEDPGSFQDFINNPSEALFSGLTIYGGLIMAMGACIYYIYKNGLPILHFIDATAPGLILAYGIGRMGCHVSGDGDWGIVNTAEAPGFLPNWLWATRYPNNVIKDGIPIQEGTCFDGYCTQLAEPVFPTPLYEFLAALLIFGVLWYFRKKLIAPGMLFALYLMLNGVERFFIEKIRVNTEYDILGGITQAEIISSLFFTIGLSWFIYLYKRKKAIPNVKN